MADIFLSNGICKRCGVPHPHGCPREAIKIEKPSEATCPYCGVELTGHAGPRSCEESRKASREADEREKAAKRAIEAAKPIIRRFGPPPDNQ